MKSSNKFSKAVKALPWLVGSKGHVNMTLLPIRPWRVYWNEGDDLTRLWLHAYGSCVSALSLKVGGIPVGLDGAFYVSTGTGRVSGTSLLQAAGYLKFSLHGEVQLQLQSLSALKIWTEIEHKKVSIKK